MRTTVLRAAAAAAGVFAAATVLTLAQAPDQSGSTPTVEQMRRAVSQLRGGRIATPNDYDALTPEQRAYVESILSGPRNAISGPLGVMMVSPVMGDLVQKSMAYARFAGREGFSSVSPKLNELAILVVARHWTADYIWNAHHRYAVQVGLAPEVVEAIRVGKRPAVMDKDVEAVYNFATTFITDRKVDDATVQAARAALGGDKGLVDLVGTMGLYQISAMMVVLDGTPLPEGRPSFFE